MSKNKVDKITQSIEDFFNSNPQHGFKATYVAKKVKCKVSNVYQFKYRNKDKIETVNTGKSSYYLLKVDQQN